MTHIFLQGRLPRGRFFPSFSRCGGLSEWFASLDLVVLVRPGRMAPTFAVLRCVSRVFTRSRIAVTHAQQGLQRAGCARLFFLATLKKRDGRVEAETDELRKRHATVLLRRPERTTSLALHGSSLSCRSAWCRSQTTRPPKGGNPPGARAKLNRLGRKTATGMAAERRRSQHLGERGARPCGQ